MKEAAGEANLTVIAIVLIGVVAAVVTPLINGLLKGQAARSCCNSLGGVYKYPDQCEGSGVDQSAFNACRAGQTTDNTGNTGN